MHYILTRMENTAKSNGRWHYVVSDSAGSVIDTRDSNRDYTAAAVVKCRKTGQPTVSNYAGKPANVTKDVRRFGLELLGVARLTTTLMPVVVHGPADYRLIDLWHRSTGSLAPYIARLQERAYAERAPLTALYHNGKHGWRTTADLSAGNQFLTLCVESGLDPATGLPVAGGVA